MMQIFTFTEKEYQALIERLDALNEKVAAKHNPKPEEIIFDNADALKLLKVSRRTLQQWRTDGMISFSQVGSKLYYTQKDISEFIQRHYQKRFA
ncbi:MAG: helix-turn-helix domain-containing protein [Bacteroidota bacterium]